MRIKRNIISFLIIGALGTIFHFVYEWTNDNTFAGCFFPVNESIWEHLKLYFYPALIYYSAEYFVTKPRSENYTSQIAISIYAAFASTLIIYYLYYGILGFNLDFLNITIFFISVIVLIITRNKIDNSQKFNTKNSKITFLILLVIQGFLFAVWSYNPPSLGIFLPPRY